MIENMLPQTFNPKTFSWQRKKLGSSNIFFRASFFSSSSSEETILWSESLIE